MGIQLRRNILGNSARLAVIIALPKLYSFPTPVFGPKPIPKHDSFSDIVLVGPDARPV